MECVVTSSNGQGSIAYVIALDGSNKTGYVYDVGSDISQCQTVLLDADKYAEMANYGSLENIDKELLAEYFFFFFSFTLLCWLTGKGIGQVIEAIKKF